MISADVIANVRQHKNRRCEGQNLLVKSEKNYLSMIPNTTLTSPTPPTCLFCFWDSNPFFFGCPASFFEEATTFAHFCQNFFQLPSALGKLFKLKMQLHVILKFSIMFFNSDQIPEYHLFVKKSLENISHQKIIWGSMGSNSLCMCMRGSCQCSLGARIF